MYKKELQDEAARNCLLIPGHTVRLTFLPANHIHPLLSLFAFLWQYISSAMPKYKIAMLGPGGVGKTCLVDRFCDVPSDQNVRLISKAC